MSRYKKIVENLRSKAEIFKKSNYAVDGVVKCFEESADTIEPLAEELKQFKDKEEQGLLIELKVPLGTRIWYLEEDYHEGTVEISTTFYDFRWLYCHKDEEFYLTRSEAEEALARMKGE